MAQTSGQRQRRDRGVRSVRPARRWLAVALTVIMVSLPAAAAYAAPVADRHGNELLAGYAKTFGVPGVAAAVVTGDGVTTFVHGHDGDDRPVTAGTRFRIASMSKSITATAVMQLVQQGRITLDQPVSTAIPDFRMADPRAAAITIRQVLSHTSGLSIRTNNEYTLPAPRTAAEAVAALAGKRLAADPGTRFEYHNTNYTIAARIVEVQAGQPFDRYLTKAVFGPLGMADTSATAACDATADRLPTGFNGVFGLAVGVPEMPGNCVGNGGVVSTVADMATWIRFNQGALGGDVLSPARLAELHAVQPAAPQYALGWERQPAGPNFPAPLVQHGGTLTTFTGAMAFAPGTGTGAVVLTNRGGDPMSLVHNLIAVADGHSRTPFSDPQDVVNAIILGLVALAAAGLITAAVRARTWAARRRARPKPRVLLRLIPLAALTVLGALLPVLLGMLFGITTWQSWIVFAWLYPLLDLLGLVLLVAGAMALVRRIVAWRAAAPAAPAAESPGS